MLGQRRRRWANGKTTLVEHLVSAGIISQITAVQSQKAVYAYFASKQILLLPLQSTELLLLTWHRSRPLLIY